MTPTRHDLINAKLLLRQTRGKTGGWTEEKDQHDPLGSVLPYPLLRQLLPLHFLRPHRLVALEDRRVAPLRVGVDHLHVAAHERGHTCIVSRGTLRSEDVAAKEHAAQR